MTSHVDTFTGVIDYLAAFYPDEDAFRDFLYEVSEGCRAIGMLDHLRAIIRPEDGHWAAPRFAEDRTWEDVHSQKTDELIAAAVRLPLDVRDEQLGEIVSALKADRRYAVASAVLRYMTSVGKIFAQSLWLARDAATAGLFDLATDTLQFAITRADQDRSGENFARLRRDAVKLQAEFCLPGGGIHEIASLLSTSPPPSIYGCDRIMGKALAGGLLWRSTESRMGAGGGKPREGGWFIRAGRCCGAPDQSHRQPGALTRALRSSHR